MKQHSDHKISYEISEQNASCILAHVREYTSLTSISLTGASLFLPLSGAMARGDGDLRAPSLFSLSAQRSRRRERHGSKDIFGRSARKRFRPGTRSLIRADSRDSACARAASAAMEAANVFGSLQAPAGFGSASGSGPTGMLPGSDGGLGLLPPHRGVLEAESFQYGCTRIPLGLRYAVLRKLYAILVVQALYRRS